MADERGGKSKGRTTNRKPATRRSPQSASSPMVCHCKICDEVIKEPNEPNGDNSVLCNGTCAGWIHRRCAGLSQVRFKEISKSNDPFYCPSCCATDNRREIESLKSIIKSLVSELDTLKTALSPEPSGTQPSLAASPKPPTKPDDEYKKPDDEYKNSTYSSLRHR